MRNDTGVLVVFTAKSKQQILDAGGTQSWVLNERSMANVPYVVCTRNSDRQHDVECGIRPELHNAAFIVGKVSGLTKVDRRNDRDRYLVKFSEYALVDVPDFRFGTTRNPVTYSDAGQCKAKGIDLDTLDWHPMPATSAEAASTLVATKGLTIAEAKAGLSEFFGVPQDSIQITISG